MKAADVVLQGLGIALTAFASRELAIGDMAGSQCPARHQFKFRLWGNTSAGTVRARYCARARCFCSRGSRRLWSSPKIPTVARGHVWCGIGLGSSRESFRFDAARWRRREPHRIESVVLVGSCVRWPKRSADVGKADFDEAGFCWHVVMSTVLNGSRCHVSRSPHKFVLLL